MKNLGKNHVPLETHVESEDRQGNIFKTSKFMEENIISLALDHSFFSVLFYIL